ncbi:WecB/TagA/CpsF family glycosyltransferase [Acidicapsa acidisoli]|uniref:WecB/TagA/CpsF family glycosyltransferase n=1 Tax=Acidicapsa acidisoli TaxID=1615681 RepID=UPI0021E0BDE9|nr:WecB/TagA/CpsF family glycosyltransferase [Acidicapsa acidisoli]
MKTETISKSVKVLGIPVDPLDMESALGRIAEELQAHRKGYVCLIGVHGIMEAQRDPGLAQVYVRATLMVPDGTPTVWMGRWQGFSSMQRVAGPDLMLEIFRRKEFAHFTHFLYGGKEGVAEDLRDRLVRSYPWVRIIGTHTPPYRDLNQEEEDSLAGRIRDLKPDLIWVGISTPKQERFMMRFLPLLDSTVMFGVGAAFDFHTGRIKDAPQWVKSAGLQWLHRLIQDPRHLFWRYLRNNSSFLWHIMLQLTGLREYPQTEVDPGFSVRAQSVANR